MKWRLTGFFAFFILLFFGLILRVNYISTNNSYLDAAGKNGSFDLSVTSTRGTIYDCNMKPLVNNQTVTKAAVIPTPQSIMAFSSLLKDYDKTAFLDKVKYNKPFIQIVNQPIKPVNGIQVFNTFNRYSDNQLAAHIIGYVNSDSDGVAGIEKGYDDVLKKGTGYIKCNYKTDVNGNYLLGVEPKIENTSIKSNIGIQLTIDRDIQEIAENAMDKYIQKGACVIMDSENGDLKAVVSRPTFNPNSVDNALNDNNAPLLNRAVSSYNVGSVFKIVTASAYLEAGKSPNIRYTCLGKTDIDGITFKCNNTKGHGTLNLEQALAYSCNLYFINLGSKAGGDSLFNMMKKYGLGQGYDVARGVTTLSGAIPSKTSLQIPSALANTSFGQGDLMATPVQIASVISTIANDGVKPYANLVSGEVDEDKNIINIAPRRNGEQVITKQTADIIRKGLFAVLDYGTGKVGKPENVEAAGKTATAETGLQIDGKPVDQSWFAGYFVTNGKKYSVVVLAENTSLGRKTTLPVFKEIAENVDNHFKSQQSK